MKEGWEIKKVKDICDKASSNIAQNKITQLDGDYPVYGASGFVQNVDFYHRDTEYIGIVKDGSGVGRVNTYPAYSSLLGTLQYILPKEGYSMRFVSYALKSLNLAKFASGAAIPHIYFKDYGEVALAVPTSLAEQERIGDVLDMAFDKIDALKENAEMSLKNAKDLFQAVLRKELEPKEGWESKTVDGVVKDIFSGGDAPKGNLSKEPTEDYRIPIYANAVENDGLYGYTNYAKVQEPSITIAARGSGTGYTLRRYDAYLPIVRLIVIIPNSDVVSLDYLYYSLRSMNIDVSGSAIPQLTVPMLKKHIVSYPISSEEQVRIVSLLDTLHNKCIELESNYERAITLCNDLKQALLRKAFNGEL